MYKKRFNVAVSRARDQLWVVHSLDLKDGDIRKKLILHASNPQAFAPQLAEQEKKTDSEFERQVLQRLTHAGYRVTPQWPVGAYRIDLVVEGAGKRLAVECDGDRWHPIEKLEEDMARQAILERWDGDLSAFGVASSSVTQRRRWHLSSLASMRLKSPQRTCSIPWTRQAEIARNCKSGLYAVLQNYVRSGQ
jgi:very-short-patch-repair endonuclease